MALLLATSVQAGVLDEKEKKADPTTPTSALASRTPVPAATVTNSIQPSGSQLGNPSQPKTDSVSFSQPVDTNNPYDALARDLASASVPGEKMSVAIGKFLDGDGDTASPYSARLREELAVALPKTGKFEVITRERLADLQDEEKFQSSDIASPGSDASKVQVRTIHGIIRGRIYAKPGELEIFAHIAHLNGGEIHEIKALIPLQEKVVLHEQSIDPIQWLVENKRERPTEVTLTKEVTIPLVAEGKSVGTMRKPSGTVIHVDDLTATEIKTQICGVSLTIPVVNTNLEEMAKEKLKSFLKDTASKENEQKSVEPTHSLVLANPNKEAQIKTNPVSTNYTSSRFLNTKWMLSEHSICFSADGKIYQWARWRDNYGVHFSHWIPVDNQSAKEIDGEKRTFQMDPDGLRIRQPDGHMWLIYN